MGVGLVHFGFLAAAAAVAVPVLIHLLLRPRARRVDIGSVHFLRVALRDHTRRRKLRRWLLLALRSAAVLLLALLFARPYLHGDPSAGGDREVVVLVDDSASMSSVHGRRTAFDEAQEAAEAIFKDLPPGTAAHLAYFDARGVRPAEPRPDRTRQPGHAGGDFGLALQWARDKLTTSQRPHRKLYVLTDLQRSGARGPKLVALGPGVAVELVDVGRAWVRNLSVEAAEAPQPTLRPNEPVVVTAVVANAGAFAAKGVTARLRLTGPDGRPLPEVTQTLTVGPRSRSAVRFEGRLPRPGLYAGAVSVDSEDDFPADNARWLAFDARPPDRILLADGEPGGIPYADETYYLEAALRLRLPAKGQPLTPYLPERVALAAGATLPALDPFAVVVLCNVGTLAPADADRLRTYVARGGRLLVFTGKHVEPAAAEPLTKAGVLPAAVEGTASPDLYRFDTWDKAHPIFRPLSDPQHGDLRRVAFRQITRLKPASGATVLASAQDGQPLVIDGTLEKGRVVVVAAPADRDWGDWPQGRLYVPLIHQLVGYLTGRLPEDSRVRLQECGAQPPGVVTADAVTVRNLDPRESEAERLTPDEFRKTYGLPALEETARRQAALAALAPLPGGERPDELWPAVAWVLLAVLTAELFLASRTLG